MIIYSVLVCCIWPHHNHLWETLSSLRFASRMRCIENHPTRNSLVSNVGVSSSTRPLQLKIEALKKELALRDAMCGYAMYTNPIISNSLGTSLQTGTLPTTNLIDRPPILETLTKNQQNNCQKMISQFVLTGSDKDLDVRSLAEVKVLANYLRTALWNACNGNQDNLIEILKNAATNGSEMFQDDNGQYTSRKSSTIIQNYNSIEEGEEQEEQENQDQDQQENQQQDQDQDQEGGYFNNENQNIENLNVNIVNEEKENDINRNNNGNDEIGGNEINYNLGDNEVDGFSQFKLSEGREYHENYETLKKQLKDAKNRQKTLVKQVNQSKVDIDNLTTKQQQQQQSSNEQNDNEEIIATLVELKGQYKLSRGELIKCKEEIVELTRLKQLALNQLVTAYEQFIMSHKEESNSLQEEVESTIQNLVVEDMKNKNI